MKLGNDDKIILVIMFVILFIGGICIGFMLGGTEQVYFFNQTCQGCVKCGVCICP